MTNLQGVLQHSGCGPTSRRQEFRTYLVVRSAMERTLHLHDNMYSTCAAGGFTSSGEEVVVIPKPQSGPGQVGPASLGSVGIIRKVLCR